MAQIQRDAEQQALHVQTKYSKQLCGCYLSIHRERKARNTKDKGTSEAEGCQEAGIPGVGKIRDHKSAMFKVAVGVGQVEIMPILALHPGYMVSADMAFLAAGYSSIT